jgi:hypothetical protein
VPVAVFGYEQESHAALVRHEDLRESDEGTAIQGIACSGLKGASPVD